MARMNPRRRAIKAAKRYKAIHAETQTGFVHKANHVRANVASESAEMETFRLHNADQYGMVCGERTLAFVGKLPGGMNGSIPNPKNRKNRG